MDSGDQGLRPPAWASDSERECPLPELRFPKGDESLKPGEPVTIENLVSKPELNGQAGVVVPDEAASGRVGVRLDFSKKPIALKTTNLSPGLPVGAQCMLRAGKGFKIPDDVGRVAIVVRKLPHGCHEVKFDDGRLVECERGWAMPRWFSAELMRLLAEAENAKDKVREAVFTGQDFRPLLVDVRRGLEAAGVAKSISIDPHQKSMVVLTTLELLRFQADIEFERGNLSSCIQTYRKALALNEEELLLMRHLHGPLMHSYALVLSLLLQGLNSKLVAAPKFRTASETDEEIVAGLRRAIDTAALSKDEQAEMMGHMALMNALTVLPGVSEETLRTVLEGNRAHISRCEQICSLPEAGNHNPVNWKMQYGELLQGTAMIFNRMGDMERAVAEQRRACAVFRGLQQRIPSRTNFRNALANLQSMVYSMATKRLRPPVEPGGPAGNLNARPEEMLSGEEARAAQGEAAELLALLPESARACAVCAEAVSSADWQWCLAGCKTHVLHTTCAEQWASSLDDVRRAMLTGMTPGALAGRGVRRLRCPVCRDDTMGA